MDINVYSNKDLTSSPKSMVFVNIVDDENKVNKEFVVAVDGMQQVVRMELLGLKSALLIIPQKPGMINISTNQTTIDYIAVDDNGAWAKEPKNNIDLVEEVRYMLERHNFSVKRINSKFAKELKSLADPYMTRLKVLLESAGGME